MVVNLYVLKAQTCSTIKLIEKLILQFIVWHNDKSEVLRQF